MYEVAEWSDYHFFILGTVKTEKEAKEWVERLGQSAVMNSGYRKVIDGKTEQFRKS